MTVSNSVSILAHPERWALRQRRRDVQPHAEVSILAHPERWALLYRENLPNFQTVNMPVRRTSFSYGIILIPFVQPHAQTPCEISPFSRPRTSWVFASALGSRLQHQWPLKIHRSVNAVNFHELLFRLGQPVDTEAIFFFVHYLD